MDFSEEVKAFARNIHDRLEHINSEALTQSALVEPFLRVLGYDTSNPAEVIPQYGANLDLPGVKKDKHVDYGILKSGIPIALIEVKSYDKDPTVGLDQLHDYFHKVSEVKIGIATNGVRYCFYSDLEKPNIMDRTPYLEVDLLHLKDSDIEAMQKLTKSAFDLDKLMDSADRLKYVNGILEILRQQFDNTPDDEFVRFFFKQLYNGSFTGQMKDKFFDFTQRALKQFVREKIYQTIATGIGEETESDRSLQPQSSQDTKDNLQQIEDVSKIVTTEEELEGYYIVKSIVRNTVEPSRITYKDVQSYFNILLDDNSWKPICRLHLNNSRNKKLELVAVTKEGNKDYEKVAIDDVNDIYRYADRLNHTVAAYQKQ